MTQYILFCSQDTDSRTKSIIIPVEKYLQSNSLINNFNMLRKHATKYDTVISNATYRIDNLLFQNFVFEYSNDVQNKHDEKDCLLTSSNHISQIGYSEKNEYSKIITEMLSIIEKNDTSYIIQNADWKNFSHINICSSNDPIDDYCKLINMKTYKNDNIDLGQINICEGFLILETNNNVFEPPVYYPLIKVVNIFSKEFLNYTWSKIIYKLKLLTKDCFNVNLDDQNILVKSQKIYRT